MHASRVRGLAAAARATPAGIIESSRGKASAAPAPRSNARRERCRFVRYVIAIAPETSALRRKQLDAEIDRISESKGFAGARRHLRTELRELAAHACAI